MAITEEELERIRHYERKPVPKYPYWYGMKRALYESIELSNWLPVSCHLQHGVGAWRVDPEPDLLTLTSPYPVLFLENQYQVDIAKAYTKAPIRKPIYPIGSVFARYRRYKQWAQRPDAKGSLAYISHSTLNIQAKADWESLITAFKQLPPAYHPITVSVYFKECLKGVHELFMDAGFDVVTAGHMFDPYFVDRFYEILSGVRYVVCNDFGSHIYYATEMDIPVLVTGNTAEYFVSEKERSTNRKSWDYQYVPSLQETLQLYTHSQEAIEAGIQITPEQYAHTHQIMGTEEALSSEAIKTILQRHQTGHYLKELALSPLKLPLRAYRSIKARFS